MFSDNRISIKELKKLIFGAKTEKTRQGPEGEAAERTNEKNDAPKDKPKGHGRNGCRCLYRGRTCMPDVYEVRPGDRCPKCGKGKLYRYAPSEIVCIRGQAPIQATIYELERLRCNLCGAWFSATTRRGGERRQSTTPVRQHDGRCYITAAVFRIQPSGALQKNLGMPLPSSTQWDVISDQVFGSVQPVGEELQRQAANSDLFHNDDTRARVLALREKIAEEVEAAGHSKESPHRGLHHRHHR